MALSENEVEGSSSRAIESRRAKSAKPQKPKKEKPAATQMTFFEHVGELRSRLVWSALTVLVCTIVAWFFHRDLVQAFKDLAQNAINELVAQGKPAPEFVTTNIVNQFSIYFEVSVYAGLLLASPVLVYHILAFMAPALEPETKPGDPSYDQEIRLLKSIRRSLVFFIPMVAIFFLAGIAFSYYLLLPPAIKFLLSFGIDQFKPLIDGKQFIGQMSKIMFWTGIVFELPIFLFLLAKIQVVTWRKLVSFWKWALVLSLVVAAFITPSPDLIWQGVIGLAVYSLFWLGVLFARFA
jgi:sec-independent protein translocase protein TatC